MLSRTRQLSSEIGKAKISKCQVAQKLQCKLQSTAQRLAEVESLRELWRTECENQRQLEAELESKTRELCERNQELSKQLEEKSLEGDKLDYELGKSLEKVSRWSIERINTKLSAKASDLFRVVLPPAEQSLEPPGDEQMDSVLNEEDNTSYITG